MLTGLLTWIDIPSIQFSVENGMLYFVNRDVATSQLFDVHFKNYTRALLGEGSEWGIAIADHIPGLGKSAFGNNYITLCGSLVEKNSAFQELICSCKTVTITSRSTMATYWMNLDGKLFY